MQKMSVSDKNVRIKFIGMDGRVVKMISNATRRQGGLSLAFFE